ncbi:recombination protein RecR [Thermoleophilum album]|uniref:recombination mediator RecR n=1 Tax=Thermoleophilum album TaxID=29539 RepID=UPI00237CE2D5|nr:recombination mediator RecR [Thermoleophilum album]WDT93902.1 recombination protein RecR [Thermoleophilum album]
MAEAPLGTPTQADALERAITELSRLPGIGRRTAQRLAFFLLGRSGPEVAALAEALLDLKRRIGECRVCFNFAEGELCAVCSDERREHGLICVVEQPSDIFTIERSGEFRGRYHVLGGALSPIDGVDVEDLRFAQLFERIARERPQEVVIATNATTTGEATALYLADELHRRFPELRVTRLASGLPAGADLEYADELTVSRALRGRYAL